MKELTEQKEKNEKKTGKVFLLLMATAILCIGIPFILAFLHLEKELELDKSQIAVKPVNSNHYQSKQGHERTQLLKHNLLSVGGQKESGSTGPPRSDEVLDEVKRNIRSYREKRVPLFPDGGFWEKADAFLDQMLSREEHNQEWTRKIETEGREYLEGVGMHDTEIASVDCRESICKVEFFHNDERAVEKFKVLGIAGIAPWKGERYGSFRDDTQGDKIESYMFFAPGGFKK